MSKPLKFVAGAVLVAAGFLIPGAGQLVKHGLLLMGSSLVVASLTPSVQPVAGILGRQAGVELNEASPASWLPVVYGRARLGLKIVDLRTTGPQNQDLWIVGALSVGSEDGLGIAAIEEVFFDGALAIDAGGTVQSRWSGRVQFAKFLGTDSQNVATGAGAAASTLSATLNATFPSDWPTTSSGKGIAVLVLKLTYGATAFPSGRPEVTVTVRGQRVPDVRTSGEPRGYATNPALCLYDYLRSARYGLASPTSEVDGATTGSFATMANYYDELVTIPGSSQKRFEANGWVSTGDEPAEIVRQLLTACRGNLVWQDGKLLLFTRRATTPVSYALTEDQIVGPLRFRVAGAQDSPNVMRATYLEARGFDLQPWTPNTLVYPRPTDANSFLTADNNFEVQDEIELPLTANAYTAEQIAAVELQERRDMLAVEITATEDALQLAVGDVVNVTHPTPGWSAKPFWVDAVVFDPDSATVALSLHEYNASAYTLPGQGTFTAAPNTSLPDLSTCQPPSGLVLTSDATTAFRLPGGSRQAGIKVTWTASPDGFLARYEVQARPTGAAAWSDYATPAASDTQAVIGPVDAGTSWDVRVRAVNSVGVASTYVQASITAADLVVATGAQAVLEAFEASHVLWSLGQGSATLARVADQGVAGNAVLRITGGGGTVTVRARYPEWIPFDPSKLYRVRFRVRQFADPTSGTKFFQLGLEEADRAKALLLDGTLSAWCAARDATLAAGTSWTEYTGWLKGTAASRTYPAQDARAPMPCRPGTAYVRPNVTIEPNTGGQLDVDYVAVEVLDEEAERRLYQALTASANLQSQVTQTTPTGQGQQILRGRQRGTATHGQAVTFSPAFPQPPQSVRIWGGLLDEPRSKWSTNPDSVPGTLAPLSTAATQEDVAAVGLTASGFTVRALLRQDPAAQTQQSNAFPAGTLSNQGDSLAVTVASAPANDNTYRARYTGTLSATAGTGPDWFADVTITVAIDVSLDSGTTWTELATRTYSVSADPTTGSQTLAIDDTVAVTQSGLDATDKIRARIKSRTQHTASGATVGVSVDPDAVTYTTGGGATQWASKTPDAGQLVTWEADYYSS